MHDHDAVLDEAISEIATILADALLRVMLSEETGQTVDFTETESTHVTAG